MNKLTKLLSVFVIAGALGAGVAGVAACKKSDDGDGHRHNYTWVNDENGKCHEHCDVDGCDNPDKTAEKHVDTKDGNGICDRCGATIEHEHDYAWENNDDGTHSGHCDVPNCDTPDVLNEKHEWNNETHRCEKCEVRQPKYNVTFNMHGVGTAPDAQEVYDGDKIAAIQTPANTETKYFGGWYKNADYTGGRFDLNAPVTGALELHARWLDIIEISTFEEFEEFRTTATAEDGTGGLAAGAYVLKADIDCEGETLAVATCIIGDGVIFDGQGHVIKNASYSGTESKIGILCEKVNGGVVTNVKFLNCAIASTSETVGIIAGECNVSSSFSKIEFNSCSAVTTNNYVGLIFGRVEGANSGTIIDISEITVKNGSYTSCTSYGGFLIGDTINGTTINFKDLHVDGEFMKSNQNGSFIAGRTRDGAVVNVENAVISATMPDINSMGIFAGGGAATLNLKNIIIIKSNTKLLACSNKTHTLAKENVVTVDGVTVTDVAATGANTVAYLKDTLGFDFTNVWEAEGTNGYRLRAASTNVKGADAKLTGMKVSTGNAKLRFKAGEDFSSTGLTVMGVYSDGVQLVITEGVEYEVDSTEFDKTTAGTYKITVRATEADATAAEQTYEVTVIAETGFEINHEFMSHVYLRGDELDTKNLVLYSTWSDGSKEKVAAKDIKIVPQSYNMTSAGSYQVSVAYKDYPAQLVTISVIDTKVVPVDGKLYVNVDPTAIASKYSGAQINGVETFADVRDAIDYLEACNLDKSVQKVIRIAAGTYNAKITTDLENLTLIGLGTNIDDVKLTYGAVESTVDPLTGSTYGMNCATFHVKGAGFKAYNVYFDNSFDYKTVQNSDNKESSPQGFALTVNGDGAYIEHCHMYGNQDTLYIKEARAYFKDCLIEGNVDFIFGEGKNLAYFDNCNINAVSRFLASEADSKKTNNGYVTAAKHSENDKPDYGYIFNGCQFTADSDVVAGSMSLGRPWGKYATVAIINCELSAAYSTHGYKTDLQSGSTTNYLKGRWEEMSGNSPVYTTDNNGKVTGADFCEYGNTGAGAIDSAVTGGRLLTEAQAANYTAANLFAATNGKTTWSAAWDYSAAATLLGTLRGALATEAGDLYVSAESVEVAEESSVKLLISNTPWNLDDKGLDIVVADESIATYGCGEVTGVAEGTTTITVSKDSEVLKVINVTVTAKDPTIRESVNYVYAQNDRADGTAESNFGKIKFEDMVVNNSWLRWNNDNSAIKFTALKGTIITITVNGSEVLTFNDTEVAAVEKVVTYTVPKDGEVVIKRKSGTSCYLRTISLNVPITTQYVYNYKYASDKTGEPAQGTALEDAPIYIVGGKHNNGYVSVTGGLYLNVVEGTVINIAGTQWDKPIIINGDTEAVLPKIEGTDNYTLTVTKELAGLLSLTPNGSQFYLTSFSVNPPKTDFSYKYGSETNGDEWTATNCGVGKVAKVNDGKDDDSDATHIGLQINDKTEETESYLELAVAGTKATINSIVGYTLGTNNASEWLVIEFLDASGNVLDTVKGTTTAKKAFGEYTLSKTAVETETQFVKIRFKSVSGQDSQKSVIINSIDIHAE